MKKVRLSHLKKSRDILIALKKYGVLNRRTIQQLVPSIKNERNLRSYLRNLQARRLIVKRFDSINGVTGTFYQLNQKPKIREALAQYLDCQVSEIQQREYRYKELFHEQRATLIKYYLTVRYPEAIVLKDFELVRNLEARKVIPHLENKDQLRPDVLFLIPNYAADEIVSVAFEFEKTTKSKARIDNKLKFYTSGTQIDGVIYVNTADMISNVLDDIYDSHVLEESIRIKHYGENFLLTGLWKNAVEKSFDVLRNQNGEYYNLDHFITTLRRNSLINRGAKTFSEPPTPCVDVDKYDL